MPRPPRGDAKRDTKRDARGAWLDGSSLRRAHMNKMLITIWAASLSARASPGGTARGKRLWRGFGDRLPE